MFLCIFGNFPINRRKTIRNQKCVDLRKRAAAEKTAVRAQRARVRALQHQPRIRAFFHQRRLLPVDTVVAGEFPNPIDAPIDVKTVDVSEIPADMEGMDIGEKTRALFADAVKSAKTVVWNGPMGVFENPTLAKGTIAVAQALADSEAITIVGGGDSAAACEQLGFADKITHISTGGGASLEFLEGLELPGIACLQDK